MGQPTVALATSYICRHRTTLEICAPVIEDAIQAERAEERLVAEGIEDRPVLLLAPLQRAERGVAGHLRRLEQDPPQWGPIDADKALPRVEHRTGQTGSDFQRIAVSTVLNAKIAIITGGPEWARQPWSTAFYASSSPRAWMWVRAPPTGRAAKRLSQWRRRAARSCCRT